MDCSELYKEIEKQKSEMLPDERFAAYMKGEEVDCLPYGLLGPEEAFAAMWGFTIGQLRRSIEAKSEVIRRVRDSYGFTGLSIPLNLRGLGEAMGSELEYPENQIDYVKSYAIMDYDQLWKAESFEARKSPKLLSRIEEGKRLKDAFPDMRISTSVAGPISTAIAIRPIEMVLKDMRKNPEQLRRLLERAVDCSLDWAKMFREEFPDGTISVADPVTTTDILGRRYFEEFSKPYFKRLFDGLTAVTGSGPMVHICGHTKKIWKDLMEIGVDNFSFDNCESLTEAREVMGERVFLLGNVAPVDVMLNGSIDTVIEAVRQTIAEGIDSPAGYMLMTGCQLPIGTPKENIDAYIYAARKYGAGARKGQTPGN